VTVAGARPSDGSQVGAGNFAFAQSMRARKGALPHFYAAPVGTSGALDPRMYAEADELKPRSSRNDALTRALALARALEAMLDAASESSAKMDRQELRIAEALAGTLGDQLASLEERRTTRSHRGES
jgi:hypothetical protein